jgi:L-iditol 2-dehydrogenase
MLYGPEDLRVETGPMPRPAPGELLLTMQAALTCGTDVKSYLRGHHPVLFPQLPAVFGHEGAGRVAAVGPGVTGFAVGDLVVAANSAPCGACFFCQRQQQNLCQHLTFLNGTYASHMLVPDGIVARNTYRLPDDVPAAVAAFAEPLAIAIRGAEGTGIVPGEHVAVLGLGPIGLLLIHLAVQAGAHVTALGRSALKRRLAETFAGAQQVVDVSQLDAKTIVSTYTPEKRGFDRVIEVVGQPSTWEMAIALVRRGGTVNLFGGCPAGTSVTLDTRRMHYDELTLLSLFHHTPSQFARAVDLLASGRLNPLPLITHRLPLAEANQALGLMARGEALKVLLAP